MFILNWNSKSSSKKQYVSKYKQRYLGLLNESDVSWVLNRIFLWKLRSCHRNQTNLKKSNSLRTLSAHLCHLLSSSEEWQDDPLPAGHPTPQELSWVGQKQQPHMPSPNNAASLWAGGGHLDVAVFLSGGSHQHFGQRNALSYWTVPHHGAFTIHNYIPPNASHSYCGKKPETPQAFPNTH